VLLAKVMVAMAEAVVEMAEVAVVTLHLEVKLPESSLTLKLS
jgi:hypothetical protein